MKIKVCGMRDADNIRDVDALGVDFIGLIFYDGSPRNVAEMPSYLPVNALRVGVFVNADLHFVVSKVAEYGLKVVQLHGSETLAYVTSLRKMLEANHLPGIIIVRSIAVESRSAVLKAMMWDGYVDGILFETPTKGFGGSGTAFDWSLLSSYRGNTPFFLAGGIGPRSIGSLREFSHPQWMGVDLNSRFEISPALKDVEMLRKFIDELRTIEFHGTDKVYY